MNKRELVAAIVEKTDQTQKDAGIFLDAFTDIVGETLAGGDHVQITGFGKFESRSRKERKGINPQTGEEIIIPQRKTPAFKAGSGLKKLVNGEV